MEEVPRALYSSLNPGFVLSMQHQQLLTPETLNGFY